MAIGWASRILGEYRRPREFVLYERGILLVHLSFELDRRRSKAHRTLEVQSAIVSSMQGKEQVTYEETHFYSDSYRNVHIGSKVNLHKLLLDRRCCTRELVGTGLDLLQSCSFLFWRLCILVFCDGSLNFRR